MSAQRIEFTVLGPPVPLARVRFSRSTRIDGGGVRAYKRKQVADYQRVVAQVAYAAVHAWTRRHDAQWRGDGVFHVQAKFYCKDRRRRDLDNLLKCVMDALQPGVYDDDSQVWAVSAERHIDRDKPRAELVVSRLADPA